MIARPRATLSCQWRWSSDSVQNRPRSGSRISKFWARDGTRPQPAEARAVKAPQQLQSCGPRLHTADELLGRSNLSSLFTNIGPFPACKDRLPDFRTRLTTATTIWHPAPTPNWHLFFIPNPFLSLKRSPISSVCQLTRCRCAWWPESVRCLKKSWAGMSSSTRTAPATGSR